MRLVGPINSGAAVGADAAAAANKSTETPVHAKIVAVYLQYNATPPATTDVIVKTLGTSPAPGSNTILSLPNANTSGWFYPHVPMQDIAGADVTFDGTNEIYTKIPVADLINVSIAGANAGDNVDAWLLVE